MRRLDIVLAVVIGSAISGVGISRLAAQSSDTGALHAASDLNLKTSMQARQLADQAAALVLTAQKAAESIPAGPPASATTVVQAPPANPLWVQIVASITDSIKAIVVVLITGLLARYSGPALAAFQKATNIKLTDQQVQAVKGAAQTAAGIVETLIDQGAMHVSEVATSNPRIIALANDAIARVPDAAGALGKSTASMAATIVGLANTSRIPVASVSPQVAQPAAFARPPADFDEAVKLFYSDQNRPKNSPDSLKQSW